MSSYINYAWLVRHGTREPAAGAFQNQYNSQLHFNTYPYTHREGSSHLSSEKPLTLQKQTNKATAGSSAENN